MTIAEHCNNPLNVRTSLSKWIGKIGEYKGFVKFDTKEHGLRAAMLTMLTYIGNWKLKSVKKIIYRWAPPSENKTSDYVKVVAKAMYPDSHWFVSQYYEIRTEEEFIALVAAMAMVESGFRDGEMIVNVFDKLKKEPLSESKKAVLAMLEENSLNA